jgi:hypothetical protein
MQTHILKLTPLEAGILRGILEKHKEIDDLPKALHLKLDLLFAQHYVDHDTLGKQARKDIRNYRKQIAELEKMNW